MTTAVQLLPPVPDSLRERAVAAWADDVVIETYEPAEPQELPSFLDRRVYQGSSGRVYPLPFIDRISTAPVPHTWQAIHLENRWLRLMILPELGGRIHLALDKTTGYDFFYRNQVIKPALVGLAGPWMAGGVEFNWPQHHRPATWLPTDWRIEEEPDGAVTVWCSDHDPFTRMKGMHGVRLHPDRSVVELRVRLYNRTDLTQTFLWWANVAAKSGTDYQSFFPGDVDLVADHAKRAVVGFPRADRPYYGIDYPSRAGETFVSGGRTWSGDRLDFYRNIPVPTSYMCVDSAGHFFGGYDHGAQAGFVHVADPSIAVGKKQWTWGNAPFGWAWDDNLCDDQSSYVELMAGVFTDNQPDFAWLAPGETKAFTQAWFPISRIGAVAQATADAALSIATQPDGVRLGIVATRRYPVATVTVTAAGTTTSHDLDLEPASASFIDLPVVDDGDLTVIVTAGTHELLRYEPPQPIAGRDAAVEPSAPREVDSVDELYRIGLHLEQNRHATRSPETWWLEALRRDPAHPDTSIALAIRRLRDGRLVEAKTLLTTAIRRLTSLNSNPLDTSAHYHLGLVLTELGDATGAYRSFSRALWTRAWRAPAGWQLALADIRAGRLDSAEERLVDVLRCEPEHLQARAAQIWLARALEDPDRAATLLADATALDPLDWWIRDLAGDPLTCDEQTCADVALEYARLGDTASTHRVFSRSREARRPMGAPRLGLLRALLDPHDDGPHEIEPWTFPSRLAEYRALDAAGDTPAAQAALGCWLLAHDRPEEAIAAWSRAVKDPADWISRRNLGLALMNHTGDTDAAWLHYAAALDLRPDHARLRYEADQLAARRAAPLAERLELLTPGGQPVDRDDATVVLAHHLITLGRADEALALIKDRTFQPWEGGEGEALRAWDRAHVRLARQALLDGDATEATRLMDEAFEVPRSLGEQRHPLANNAVLHLVRGDALKAAERDEEATTSWTAAAAEVGDFVSMAAEDFSEQTWATLQAHRRLGDHERADDLAAAFTRHLTAWTQAPASVDYFATSLPSLLLFAEDATTMRDRRAAVMRAQLAFDSRDHDQARRLAREVLSERPDDAHAADLVALLDTTGDPA